MFKPLAFMDQQFGHGGGSDGWDSEVTGLWWWLGVLIFCLSASAVGLYLVAHLWLQAHF